MKVDYQAPSAAGELFLKWAESPDTIPTDQNQLRKELSNAGITIRDDVEIRIIEDTRDTVNFVVREYAQYQRSMDDVVEKPGIRYVLNSQTEQMYRDILSSDDRRSDVDTKRDAFNIRIGEYCIGLCM